MKSESVPSNLMGSRHGALISKRLLTQNVYRQSADRILDGIPIAATVFKDLRGDRPLYTKS